MGWPGRVLKALRPAISPNLDFMGHLLAWERTLRGSGLAPPPSAAAADTEPAVMAVGAGPDSAHPAPRPQVAA